MKNEYTIGFVSNKGKLQCRMFFNGKLQKSKSFSITATPEEVRNPSPTLERMMLNIKSEFNNKNIELYGTGKSPIKMMFPSKFSENKTPLEFHKESHDFRLKRWIDFIDSETTWADIDDELLTDYREYLESEDVATNTIRAYLFGLKKSLDDAKIRGYKVKSTLYPKILKSSMASAMSIYLTLNELKKIEAVELNERLDAVRTKFLIGAYTGARYSDFSKITSADLHTGKVQFIAQKTGQLCDIPIHPHLPALLEKYKKDISNSVMNRSLPEIGKLAGINAMVSVVRGDVKIKDKKYNFIKSHTARRTFATNVYLLSNNDMRSASQMLGHKSISTTEKYIQCKIAIQGAKQCKFFK